MLTNENNAVTVALVAARHEGTSSEQIVDTIEAVLGERVTVAELWQIMHDDCAQTCQVLHTWDSRIRCQHHLVTEQCAIAAIHDDGILTVLSSPVDGSSHVPDDWHDCASVVLSENYWDIDDVRLDSVGEELTEGSENSFTLWRDWDGGPVQLCWVGSQAVLSPDEVSPALLDLMRHILDN